MKIKACNSNEPMWKPMTVKSNIPAELSKLEELAHNMWWAWNHDARSLFRHLDEKLFEECNQNPVLLLEKISYEKMAKLAENVVVECNPSVLEVVAGQIDAIYYKQDQFVEKGDILFSLKKDFYQTIKKPYETCNNL